VIVQSFSPRPITCGASGHLRQEFCELELLDEINKLRYEGKFPDHIQGNLRNPMIRSYQIWKGTKYVPPLTHPALAQDPLPLLPVVTDAPWQIIEKKKTKKTEAVVEGETSGLLAGFVVAKGSMPVKPSKKHKLETEEFIINGKRKKKVKAEMPNLQPGFVIAKESVLVKSSNKQKLEDEEPSTSAKKIKTMEMTVIASSDPLSPVGLKWDGENYSCAYDAFFVV
jgi:hypothetical protein